MSAEKKWAILYLRPDGWWVAGDGFESFHLAATCASEQLPDHVSRKVVAVGSASHRAAVELGNGDPDRGKELPS